MGFERIKGGKGGARGKAKNPSVSAIKRKRRNPHKFANYDVGPSSTTNITSTGSQTYTVQKGVDTLTITMYGAGGGGGQAISARGSTVSGGGGGGGSKLVITLNEIAGGTVLTFGVGAGGAVAVNNTSDSSDGANTTLSYGGIDYIAGGGEGNRSSSAPGSKDGTGGAGDCDSGPVCAATAGNNGTAYNNGASSTRPGGLSLETADASGAGAGGAGSNNASSSTAAAGVNGKVVIS